MSIHEITKDYAVSPQIRVEDLGELARLGFVTIICNRPNIEVSPEYHAEKIRAAAEMAGLTFVENPIFSGALNSEALETQRAAISGSCGPVLAYCASGTRSAVVWAFCQAGILETAQILEATARAGYQLNGLAGQIDAIAKGRS